MAEYLFERDSLTWRVNRESVLLLGGRAALLMQLAHPLVAAGVSDHSDFRSAPFKRLRRTLDVMFSVVFGTVEEATRAVQSVNAVHDHVRGTTADGRAYTARDPHLLLWVHSTLVDSALQVYDMCVASLADEEKELYYDESKVIARMFGVTDDALPATLRDLYLWRDEMIASGEVAVTPLAVELADPIIRPVRVVPRRLARAASFLTASLLPEPIRTGYGLRVGRAPAALLAAGGFTARRVLPRLPAALRAAPVRRLGMG